jgi:hypothetical protein
VLNYICTSFKTKLGIDSLEEHPEISFLHLLIAGGAKDEADIIKNSLTLLNYAPCDIKQFVYHVDDFYLYQQLHNKVVIVESLSNMLPSNEEEELGRRYEEKHELSNPDEEENELGDHDEETDESSGHDIEGFEFVAKMVRYGTSFFQCRRDI